MEEKFEQRRLLLDLEKSTKRIKVNELFSLLDDHPYYELLKEKFKIDKIGNEYITIDFIDTVYDKIKFLNKNYRKYSIYAYTKDIAIKELISKDLNTENAINFLFEEYIEIDEVKHKLNATAIYNSKNSFLDEYDMTKYVNKLLKLDLFNLADFNVNYFKDLAKTSDVYNIYRSYRLVENDNQHYLRGITSFNKYYEYGVDFTFVVSMLTLHEFMKKNKGVQYIISGVHISESKLEIIVSERFVKDAGKFGKVTSSLKISTNDLGTGSLNYTNIINVGAIDGKGGFYLYPEYKDGVEKNEIVINHTVKPETAIKKVIEVQEILNTSDSFIKELNDIKRINSPDEIRVKILSKISGKRSAFKGIKELSDIFGKKIDNEISNFENLLKMCNKAEELEINFDLKDKLRYIISDIILYGKSK